MTADAPAALLGLDVGDRRIGVAVARLDVRLPRPLLTLDAGDGAFQRIHELADEHGAAAVVVGWPRGMAGQHTDQTRRVEEFVAGLRAALDLPVHLQDEALTSQKAEAELSARRKPYSREDIDALAATFILEDYMREYGGSNDA